MGILKQTPIMVYEYLVLSWTTTFHENLWLKTRSSNRWHGMASRTPVLPCPLPKGNQNTYHPKSNPPTLQPSLNRLTHQHLNKTLHAKNPNVIIPIARYVKSEHNYLKKEEEKKRKKKKGGGGGLWKWYGMKAWRGFWGLGMR